MKTFLSLLLCFLVLSASASYVPSNILYDVQSSAPATGATVSVTQSGKNILVALSPAATIATLTVNMPSSPLTGQVVTISSSQIVTALTLSNGTILNTITTLALGGYAAFAYDGTQWRRVQ